MNVVFKVLCLLLPLILVGCSNPYYNGPKTDHFDGQRFYNHTPETKRDLIHIFKWMFTRKVGEWPKEIIKIYPPKLQQRVYGKKVAATYISHATVLIQTQGINILLDPVWSERVSPVSWYGPKRWHTMPIAIKDLPPIDIVLISHNHYDHLNVASLQELQELYKPKIYTGLGVDNFLKSKGIAANSLDWWDKIDAGSNIKINYVPSQHWSSRGIWDKNYTLWGGFVIETDVGAVYFAGDSGYCKEYFKAIAKRFPKIKLSFIPIGAYKPRWLMEYPHMNPEEAVLAAKDVASTLNVAIQYDSFFELADEGYGEAVQDLNNALNKYGIDHSWFKTLPPTSTIIIEPQQISINSSCIEMSKDDHKCADK